MRAATLSICLCLSLVAGTTASQARPDFSGRWVRVEPNVPASIAHTLTVRQTSRDTSVTGVKMAEPYVTIEVDRHFDQRTESSHYPVGAVGGSVGGPSPSGEPPRTTRFATKWQGRELVIEMGSSFATPERPAGQRTEVWGLGADGTLTITVSDATGGPGPRTTAVTYKRVSR